MSIICLCFIRCSWIHNVHRTCPLRVACPPKCRMAGLDAVDNTVIVSVAFLRGAAGRARRAAYGAGWSLSPLLNLVLLACAPNARNSHVVGPNVDSKVLENIGVNGTLLRLFLSLAQSIIVILGVVINNLLANLGDVENTMKEVGGPVGIQLGVCDGVTETTDGRERLANVERKITNDGLGCGIVTTPVTSPLW